MLLSCLKLPISIRKSKKSSEKDVDILSCCLLKPKRVTFTQYLVELLFHTCLVSPLNAEELIVEKGILILEDALDFYIRAASLLTTERVIPKHGKVASIEMVTEIIVNIVH